MCEHDMGSSQRFAMRPLITIVIPTFNRRELVLKALASVFAQTYRPIEVVVVDDCSTDGTTKHLSDCDLPEPVRVVTFRSNRGPSAARNAGIDLATGEYIAFLDSDDWWLPHKLERQVSFLLAHPTPQTVLAYSKVFIQRKHEILIRPHYAMGTEGVANYIFTNGGHFNSSNIMLATEIARTVKYDERLRLHEDWDFYMRLEACGVEFVMIPEALSTTDDRAVVGRASSEQPAVALGWLESKKNQISPRAYLALRAKIAPYLRKQEPLTALRFILNAYKHGAITTWYLLALTGALIHPKLRDLAYRVRGAVHEGSLPEQHRAQVAKSRGTGVYSCKSTRMK